MLLKKIGKTITNIFEKLFPFSIYCGIIVR